MVAQDEAYLTIEEAAALIKIKPATLRLWLREGRMKGYRAGARWRIRREDLEAYLARALGETEPKEQAR
jgi:excisionase family DNA binding protein